ncbi:MAG: hypothetical protein R2850_13460 [Bacteroidia bacterium]
MYEKLKVQLYDVISGKSQVRFGTVIQAIASYLEKSEETGREIKIGKHFKEQEEKRLKDYIEEHHLWKSDIDFSQYVSEGAEQRVYLKDSEHVLKLNDSIYYATWGDYFYNLILHNFFFPDTAYNLLGFTRENNILFAVVEQSFVSITQNTDLKQVKEFLTSNGFDNIRNNDYFNSELGIILEDLHDENVLTKNGILYFIDTVFYLTQEFWELNMDVSR